MEGVHAATVPNVPDQVREQARLAGGGWLDEVVRGHDLSQGVPLAAIKGSWRLDANGDPTGEYVANPDYQAPPARCPFGYR